jgi:arylsulfatase A-like enzyme
MSPSERGLATPKLDSVSPSEGGPDIIVVMIESLRADEIGSAEGTRTSATPNLDALAQHSVVFPTFVSNGFPSAPSVLAFHCSAWPHRRKEIITDFADRRFDSIPARLRDFGYETTYIGADPHFDHQDRWLPAWYSTVIDLVANGETPTDHNILTRSIEEIRRHDRAAEGRPLFEFISTYSTHYPFRLPDDAGEQPVAVTEALEPRYRQVLKYTDREVGALLSFLAARERRDRTITIVLGDHSFYMDLRRTSGLPENDNIWTTAIVAGPERFIGEPRRIVAPASHVDMLPTVLAFVGDRRPSAALGGDLFGPPRNGTRISLAVRPGGLRLDRDGASVLVDARMPTLAINRVAFPGLMPVQPAASLIDAAALADVVSDWSYLIERNRVWSPSFLASPTTRR